MPPTGNVAGGLAAPLSRAPTRCRATNPPQSCQTQQARACSVYVAKLPLVGMEAVDVLPAFAAAPAALHEMVVLHTADGATWAYDYVPVDPTDSGTIARLLAGQAVPGVARSRRLKAVPTRRCRLVGETDDGNAVAVAAAFQEAWSGELQLFRRDCRVHVAELTRTLLPNAKRRQ